MYSAQLESKHQGLGEKIAEACQEVYVTVRGADGLSRRRASARPVIDDLERLTAAAWHTVPTSPTRQRGRSPGILPDASGW